MRALLALLIAGFLVAAGVTQPGGAGTSVFVEDNANADANFDGTNGVYSFSDIVGKGLASGDPIDLGTNERAYRMKATIQNGDGAGTASTTIKDTNCTVIFDNTRVLQTSTVGSANRKFEFGEEIVGANGKPSGRNGCKIVCGGSFTWRGTNLLFGTMLRSTTGAINLIPGINAGRIANCIFFANSTFAIGQSTTGNFELIYNLDLVCNAASPVNVVANWGADQAERVTIACATPSRFINTGGRIRMRDMVLIGSPTVSDVRSTSTSDWDLIEPVWSGNATQVSDVSAGVFINEWWRWLPILVDDSANFIQNVPIRLLDKDGVDLLGTLYTDAQGIINYNTVDASLGIFDDVVKARRFDGSTSSWEERGPFTARFNMDGTTIGSLESRSYLFNFPRRSYGSSQYQLSPVLDIVKLGPPSVPAGPPIPILIADIPAPADNELRYIVEAA